MRWASAGRARDDPRRDLGRHRRGGDRGLRRPGADRRLHPLSARPRLRRAAPADDDGRPAQRPRDRDRRRRSTIARPSSRACSTISPFRDALALSGVNSINWARILAQIVYYFTARSRSARPTGACPSPCRPAISATCSPAITPSAWACRSSGWSIATNENDILARALASGVYRSRSASRPTQSPSMDIQVSSNFERLLFERLWPRRGGGARPDGRLAAVRRIRDRAASRWRRIRRDFDAVRDRRGGMRGGDGARLSRQRRRPRSPYARSASTRRARALARDPATPVDRARDRPSRQIPRRGRAGDRRAPALCRAHLADFDERAASASPCCRTTRAPSAKFVRERARAACMSVELTTLPSGLRVVTDAMPASAAPPRSACSSAPARATSDAHEHGLSHLLEHMAFKGTRRRSAREIAEAIENAGGDLNAETGVEQTAYFARVLGEDADARARHSRRHSHRQSRSMPTSSSARRTSSCRRSARSRIRPTISSSTSSPPPPGPSSRSAGRSSARARASAASTAARSTRYLRAPLPRRRRVVAAAGAVDHDALVDAAPRRSRAARRGQGRAGVAGAPIAAARS